jgi:hypothetical protein
VVGVPGAAVAKEGFVMSTRVETYVWVRPGFARQ